MDKVSFDDYLENRYKKQMEYYGKNSARNRKRYRNFQWILIILSALTPVLAALNGTTVFTNGRDTATHSQAIQVALLIVSSIVAILTTGLKTFQYQELWVKYRTAYEQLKPEIYYYEFNVPPYNAGVLIKNCSL